jgi:hypothetical protein
LKEDRERLSDRGFFVQHHNQLLASTFTRIYQGRGVEALEVIDGQWKNYRRAFLSQVQQIRIDHFQVLTRALLAAAKEVQTTNANGAQSMVRRSRRIIARLQREKAAWAVALATGFDAAASTLSGDQATAIRLLGKAVELLQQVDMQLFAAAAQHHLAHLTGDSTRSENVSKTWESLGIANPAQMAFMLIPIAE